MRVVVRSFLLLTIVVCLPAPAEASGTPTLQVKELSTKGAESPVAYLKALNLRGPMLATCYGSKEFLDKASPIEAFFAVTVAGLPSSVNVSNVSDPTNGDLGSCLIDQLGKVRFPASDGPVEVKALLGPAPPSKRGDTRG